MSRLYFFLSIRSFGLLLLLSGGIAQAQPTVTVTAPDTQASETGDTATFVFTRVGADNSQALTVNFTVDETTTAGSADYSAGAELPFFVCCGQVSIPAGESELTVTVTALPDNVTEPEEQLDITLAPGSYDIGAPASAGISIQDDPPLVSVSASDPEAAENGAAGTFTFSRTGGKIDEALTVFFSFDPATTVTANDYSTDGFPFFACCTQITIPTGAASADVTVTATPDNLAEGDEYIDITITEDVYQVGEPASARVTIIDDAPVVSLTASTPQAFENGEAGTFTFARTGGNINASMTVFFSFDPTTTVTANDYSTDGFPFFACCTQITIPAGAAAAAVIVTATPDNLAEGDEFIDITIAEDAYQVGDPASARVTIIDDAPIVTLTASTPQAFENGETGAFTFARTGGDLNASLRVVFSFDATTTAGSGDYSTGPFPFFVCCTEITISAGASSADVPVVATPDNLVEGEEVIDISLVPGDFLAGDPASARVLIIDDAAVVTLTAPDPDASEEGDTGYFLFSRAGGDVATALTVNFSFDQMTTAGSGDYTTGPFPFFNCCSEISIPSGELSSEVVIFPTADDIREPEEAIAITLASGNYLPGDPNTATVFIADDDRIFEDDFELDINTKRCRTYLQHKVDESSMQDLGPSVLDPENALEYLRCGVDASYDWGKQDCVGLHNDPSGADLLTDFNNGFLGDNLGYSDWVAGSKETAAGCVFRAY